ncbi:hypothetical protein LIER_12871 [Lithospermum erythrorhizon]|uniref:Uncharacterized protein n=1 Tax=Lithospermum erythrorhizon TaxID=34254 RepID=A0AAV3PTK3_LITER
MSPPPQLDLDVKIGMMNIVDLAYRELPLDHMPFTFANEIGTRFEVILKEFYKHFHADNLGIRFEVPSDQEVDFKLWSEYLLLYQKQKEQKEQ